MTGEERREEERRMGDETAGTEKVTSRGLSIIDDHGEYCSECGYCERSETDMQSSVSHGMHLYRLRAEDYTNLLDAGWRRSGCWAYKPLSGRTCCEVHAIRLEVEKMELSRAQKKACKKLKRFLERGSLDMRHHEEKDVEEVHETHDRQQQNREDEEEKEVRSMWEGTSSSSSRHRRRKAGRGSEGNSNGYADVDENEKNTSVSSRFRGVASSASLVSMSSPVMSTLRGHGGDNKNDDDEDEDEEDEMATLKRHLKAEVEKGVEKLRLAGILPSAQSRWGSTSSTAHFGGEEFFTCMMVPEVAVIRVPKKKKSKQKKMKMMMKSNEGGRSANEQKQMEKGQRNEEVEEEGDETDAPQLSTAWPIAASAKLARAGWTAWKSDSCESPAAKLAEALASALSPCTSPFGPIEVSAHPLGYVNFRVPHLRRADVSSPIKAARPTQTTKEPTMQEETAPRFHRPPLVLDISMQTSTYSQEAFELYQRYQRDVHGDDEDTSRRMYQRFLVDSPLVRRFVHLSDESEEALRRYDKASRDSAAAAAAVEDGKPENGQFSNACAYGVHYTRAVFLGYGSFHMHYRIGGKLVGVGVVDVLPSGLSSKYFFWDPEYRALNLGTLSALFEVEWVRKHVLCCPELAAMRYYYLGYYIHSCAKMRYKSSFRPSCLLCPTTLTWCAFDGEVQRRLDRGTAARLCDTGQDVRERDVDVSGVLVYAVTGAEGVVMTWNELRTRGWPGAWKAEGIEARIREWVRNVGEEAALNYLYVVA